MRSERPRVNQHVALRGLVRPDRLRARPARLADLRRSRPARGPVVEHHRQRRGNQARPAERRPPDERLPGKGAIRHHPRGHRPVHGGLELEQHQHRARRGLSRTGLHAPRKVAQSMVELAADVLRRQPAKGRKVQPRDPLDGDEPAQQAFDHPRVGEQPLVDPVVHRVQRIAGARATQHDFVGARLDMHWNSARPGWGFEHASLRDRSREVVLGVGVTRFPVPVEGPARPTGRIRTGGRSGARRRSCGSRRAARWWSGPRSSTQARG